MRGTRREPARRSAGAELKSALFEQLLGAARSGDRAQFDRVFDLWFDLVYSMASRRFDGNRSSAEALTRRFLLESVQFAPAPALPAAAQARAARNVRDA